MNRETTGKTNDRERPDWRTNDGSPISCPEKLKVLNENLDEMRQVCQDAFEDAVLMGCDRNQVRDIMRDVISSLDGPGRD